MGSFAIWCLLELFPFVLAVELWGETLSNKKVWFNCNNMGVVSAINNISASSPPVIRLLRYLAHSCLRKNALIYAVHIPGVDNKLSDALSRFKWDEFRSLAPESEPKGLWKFALESQLD